MEVEDLLAENPVAYTMISHSNSPSVVLTAFSVMLSIGVVSRSTSCTLAWL